jgi:hypothetical protein
VRDLFCVANALLIEIQGIADVVGLPAGDIALINILYEMVSMCTSVHQALPLRVVAVRKRH